jgi:hypothetical protein
MHTGLWWESQKRRDYYEILDVGGRVVLKQILERENGVARTRLIRLRVGTTGGGLL